MGKGILNEKLPEERKKKKRKKERKKKKRKKKKKKYMKQKSLPSDLIRESEKILDPVKIYMREMSSIPLLKRSEEIILAKKIERGEGIITKALLNTRLLHNALQYLE